MNRLSILLAPLGFGLLAPLSAQTTSAPAPAPAVSGLAQQVPVPVSVAAKHAGTYHVATGTWTRRSNVQAFGVNNDVIYANTAQSGYYYPAVGPLGSASLATIIDEGGLPGTSNLTPFAGTVDRDGYRVNAFEIAYCDFDPTPGVAGWEIGFFDSYSPCTIDLTPDYLVSVTGLPSNGCWILNIDLTNTAEEFCIGADGGETDPGWNNDPDRDSFGWSHRYVGTGVGAAGFLIAGDPAATDPGWMPGMIPNQGNGTYYGGASPCAGSTGYLTQDQFLTVGPFSGTPMPGCFFFGSYQGSGTCGQLSSPFASFYFQVFADDAGCTPADVQGVGVSYCDSTQNSTGDMGRIRALGSEEAAADYVRLVADRLPANEIGFFFTSETAGFSPTPGTHLGNVCVAGNIGRFNGVNQVLSTAAAGRIELGSMDGLWDTTQIPRSQAGNTYPAMAGSTSYFQCWFRDVQPTGGASNFTNGVAVTWE